MHRDGEFGEQLSANVLQPAFITQLHQLDASIPRNIFAPYLHHIHKLQLQYILN